MPVRVAHWDVPGSALREAVRVHLAVLLRRSLEIPSTPLALALLGNQLQANDGRGARSIPVAVVTLAALRRRRSSRPVGYAIGNIGFKFLFFHDALDAKASPGAPYGATFLSVD